MPPWRIRVKDNRNWKIAYTNRNTKSEAVVFAQSLMKTLGATFKPGSASDTWDGYEGKSLIYTIEIFQGFKP